MTSTVEFGDVYLSSFPFTSGKSAKIRPVLVLMDFGNDCLICRITSISHIGFLDLQIIDWQIAGLVRPSTVRLSRLVTLEKSLLKMRLGRLSSEDMDRVRTNWNERFRM